MRDCVTLEATNEATLAILVISIFATIIFGLVTLISIDEKAAPKWRVALVATFITFLLLTLTSAAMVGYTSGAQHMLGCEAPEKENTDD